MIDIELLKARGGSVMQLMPEEVLFQEGAICQYYFQLVSGQVRWVNFNAEGGEYLQNLLEAGESVGELPLFDGQPYAATAIANKPTVVLRLPKANFQQLLRDEPQLHFAFSALLASRLRFKFFMLKEMARKDPEDIVKNLLEYLHRTTTLICTTCHRVHVTRRQIAEMTGLRVETVIRVVQSLRKKGVVGIVDHKVYFGDATACQHQQCVLRNDMRKRRALKAKALD